MGRNFIKWTQIILQEVFLFWLGGGRGGMGQLVFGYEGMGLVRKKNDLGYVIIFVCVSNNENCLAKHCILQ